MQSHLLTIFSSSSVLLLTSHIYRQNQQNAQPTSSDAQQHKDLSNEELQEIIFQKFPHLRPSTNTQLTTAESPPNSSLLTNSTVPNTDTVSINPINAEMIATAIELNLPSVANPSHANTTTYLGNIKSKLNNNSKKRNLSTTSIHQNPKPSKRRRIDLVAVQQQLQKDKEEKEAEKNKNSRNKNKNSRKTQDNESLREMRKEADDDFFTKGVIPSHIYLQRNN